ncbi:hypothetical protein GS501_01480 [Saccharibacter sp. 17.LH.SD]|uniref:hypothetical protein n=1 Tax=Saccharibacter sp. 17.LH.SD TaxID=2689393 RepID=UPI001368748C|nr:hypothetical protein [Saccharibacter sp. 17.LH.SD]MXV43727.1 hypothetical protein [Saccharibacter sp. 17.LH.SD]
MTHHPARRYGCLALVAKGLIWASPALAENTVSSFEKQLAQRSSATAVLQKTCPVMIHAQLLQDPSSPTDPAIIEHLKLLQSPYAPIIRHVRLFCGSSLRSEAWNAYIPERLTPETRHILADGHTPFGRAVGEKNFWRERLPKRTTALPNGFILENQAILHRQSDNQPIALVIERYTGASVSSP